MYSASLQVPFIPGAKKQAINNLARTTQRKHERSFVYRERPDPIDFNLTTEH